MDQEMYGHLGYVFIAFKLQKLPATHSYTVDLVVQLGNAVAEQSTTYKHMPLSTGSCHTIVSCTPQHSGVTLNDLLAMHVAATFMYF